MGVTISNKNLAINQTFINLQIWDFVGESRYKSLLHTYVRGAFGAIFMYDVSSSSSLLDLNNWISFFYEKILDKRHIIPVIIVGGKLDLNEKRQISFDDARKFSKSYDILDVIECSAKTGENVEIIFYNLTIEIMKKRGFL